MCYSHFSLPSTMNNLDISPQQYIDALRQTREIVRQDSLFFEYPDLFCSSLHPWGGGRKAEVLQGSEIAGLGQHRERGSAIITGDYVEVCLYGSPIHSGFPSSNSGESVPCSALSPEERERRSAVRAAYRAQKQVRRLMNTNNLYMMYTCTFAPLPEEGGWKGNPKYFHCISLAEQRDYARVKALFRLFWKRLKRAGYEDIKWLVVFELHDSPKTSDLKRGTWHIHLATDTDIPEATMLRIWKHGTVGRDDFRVPKTGTRDSGVRNPGAYMSKYVGKAFNASNKHLKRYSRSRNMRRPTRVSIETFFNEVFPWCRKIVYETERIVVSNDGEETFKILSITYKLKEKGK